MRSEFGVVRGEGCSCRSCRRNCMFVPGFLIPADLNRMALEMQPNWRRWAEENVSASPGALVIKAGRMFRIPTLVMRAGEDSACVKFQNRRCSIWETAPFGCAFFGCDQPQEVQQGLAHQGLMAVYEAWQDPESWYRLMWEHLDRTGHRAEPPEVKRARMAETE